MKITKKYLKNGQYKSSKYLTARINLHNRFSSYSFHAWVWGNLPIPKEPVKILQVGCGIGQFWKENYHKLNKGSALVLTDFSENMVETAKNNLSGKKIKFAVADAENLSYDDESFDMVLAHHMLYHTNAGKSLSEIKRVVKDSGFVSITTNGERHMLNVFELGQKLNRNFPKDRHIDSFTGEVADRILPKFFDKIDKVTSLDRLYVTESQFVVDFIKSEVEARKIKGLDEDFYSKYKKEVEKVIDEDGFYIIPKISPLYICRRV